jgi:hypothetical protein
MTVFLLIKGAWVLIVDVETVLMKPNHFSAGGRGPPRLSGGEAGELIT